MDLGTGIFLSTLVMAVVALYGITKDRWNWRRFAKRAALACLGLVLVGIVAGGGMYLYSLIPVAVSRQTEYAGVRLGMSQDEVRYIKGLPQWVLAEDVPDAGMKGFRMVLETNKIPNGKSVNDYFDWSYAEHRRNINIAFNASRAVVAIQCFSDDNLGRCPKVGGIEDGDDETKVLEKLGGKPQTSISGVTKTLFYPELGIRLHLTKQRVYTLEVSSPGYVRGGDRR
jgi:hypothetical protein